MKVPIVYLCIHERLREKFRFQTFSSKEVLWILGKVYHIKKKFHYPILKELESFDLIDRINRNEIVLLKHNIDLNNTSEIYRSVGLY
ncbi:hypothetical protein LCGC14_0980000 [marine sediment metagenome]|uniref:Uncharacterized protein n=1 Tax=marine sediment metagenome TaxID=412755 RepID=A0A0F9RFK4_9ZZZZ